MITSGKRRIVGTRSSALRELMRHWRGLRGLSQLDLALEIEISQRHLSFVESGRSVPSRKVLITISDALNIPFRERNALLLASGYAPLYQEATFDDTTMAVLNNAVEQMLRNHEPHPALLLDRYWNIVRANRAATAFFSSLTKLEAFPKLRNLLELTFDPAGIRPCVEEWETVASALLARVRRESLGQVIDHTLKALLDKLREYLGADTLPVATNSESPILPITFRRRLIADEEFLSLIRRQAQQHRIIFSVCTGALLCGAAGILSGRSATTHWASLELLPSYGAIVATARVVVDGNLISAAGVTAGLDAALVLVALLRGNAAAQEIQLAIEYDPQPVFQSGSPGAASSDVLNAFERSYAPVRQARQAEAFRFGKPQVPTFTTDRSKMT